MACLFILASCKKELGNTSNQTNAKQLLRTMAEKRTYLNEHLRQGGAGIAKAMQSPDFKALLMAELLAPQNEEHELRFSSMLANPKLRPYLGSVNITNAIAAFTDLDGEDWEPVLRLNRPTPTYSRQDVGGNIDGVATEEVFAIDEGWAEDETPIVPGLEMVDDDLVPIDGLFLTEGYTDDHELWVIALDDTPTDQTMGAGDIFGPTTCTNNSEPSFKSKLDKVTVKSRKEFWLGGNSDVAIIRLTTWNTGNFAQATVSAKPEIWTIGDATKVKWHYTDGFGNKVDVTQCGVNEYGQDVKVGGFTKEEVKKKKEQAISFDLMKSWKPWRGSDKDAFTYPTCNKTYCEIKGNLMGYVIFERDPWPAKTRNARLTNSSGRGIDITYSSFETSYAQGWINYVHPNLPALPTNIKGYAVDNNEIKLNTKIEL